MRALPALVVLGLCASPVWSTPTPSDPTLPDQLSREDFLTGMVSVKPRAQACFDQYHVAGTAMVSLVIAKTGRVTSANVEGVFKATPTGDCVEKAVKTATFKPFKGAAMSETYPFMLR